MKHLIALTALLLVSGASAQYVDSSGDAAEALDLLALDWHAETDDAGTPVTHVSLALAAAKDPDAGYTVILFRGQAGADEPAQWTILHTGPGGDSAMHGNAPGEELAFTFDGNGTTLQWTYTDLQQGLPCAFGVARSVTYPEGGQQVADVIGWTTPEIGDAWHQGAACGGGQPLDSVVNLAADTSDIPAPGLLLVAAGLLAARRTQR